MVLHNLGAIVRVLMLASAQDLKIVLIVFVPRFVFKLTDLWSDKPIARGSVVRRRRRRWRLRRPSPGLYLRSPCANLYES